MVRPLQGRIKSSLSYLGFHSLRSFHPRLYRFVALRRQELLASRFVRCSPATAPSGESQQTYKLDALPHHLPGDCFAFPGVICRAMSDLTINGNEGRRVGRNLHAGWPRQRSPGRGIACLDRRRQHLFSSAAEWRHSILFLRFVHRRIAGDERRRHGHTIRNRAPHD